MAQKPVFRYFHDIGEGLQVFYHLYFDFMSVFVSSNIVYRCQARNQKFFRAGEVS